MNKGKKVLKLGRITHTLLETVELNIQIIWATASPTTSLIRQMGRKKSANGFQ